MNPISGDKLKDELLEIINADYPDDDDLRKMAWVFVTRIYAKLIRGKFNLQPGTLVIPREKGYEKRRCDDCISWDDEFQKCRPDIIENYYILTRCGDPDETFDDCHERDLSKNTECKDCEYFIPCDKHVTFDELKNAIVVGEK